MDFRAFIVGKDGHIKGCINLVCNDEIEAKEYAKRLVDGDVVELWHRDQKIAVFPHNDSD
jgi:hypothetical protein